MNNLKFVMTLMTCLLLIPSSWSQRTNTGTASVSQLIATGASETMILNSWQDLVLQKQVKSYQQAEALVKQTMQVAFLQGNKTLGAAITKTAYYSTLTVQLGEEIGKVKMALQRNEKLNITEKNFKLQPAARDLQRLAGIGKIDLVTQRKLRFNLINKSQSVLAQVPGMNASKSGKVSGKNQRQAGLPTIFNASDVIVSNGQSITNKTALNTYLKRLENAYKKADTNVRTSGTYLNGVMLTQQQVAQNEVVLTKKMLTKAASMIN